MSHLDPRARRMYQREYHQRWYLKNRAKKLAQNRAWALAHPAQCRRIANAWYARNKPAPKPRIILGRKVTWRRKSWRRAGINPEQAEAALRAFSGRCGICGADQPARRRRDWAVDHDHQTGKIRGILCHGCNMKLGWVDRVGLTAVANYLQANPHDRV